MLIIFILMLILYVCSFFWFKTNWKRWLFWGFMFVLCAVGSQTPDECRDCISAIIGLEIIRWITLGMVRLLFWFSKTI